jgi:hypothetical protein
MIDTFPIKRTCYGQGHNGWVRAAGPNTKPEQRRDLAALPQPATMEAVGVM